MLTFSEDLCLSDIVRHYAQVSPDKTALLFRDRQTSFADLDTAVDRVANGLARLGVKPGGRIAILAGNSDHYAEIIFGAARARAVVCPVNWRLAPPELRFILADAEAEVIFIERQFLDTLDVVSPTLSALRHVVVLGEDGDYTMWRDGQSPAHFPEGSQPDDVVVQMYTSGTTGKPKGVLLSNRSLAVERGLEAATPEWSSWGSDDISVVGMPMFHVSGLLWLLQFVSRGGTSIIQGQVDAEAIIRSIIESGVTRVMAVPAVLKQMVEHPLAQAADFSALRTIGYGGAPIAPELLRRAVALFGAGCVQMYGMTETSGTVAWLAAEDHDPARPERLASCGRALPGIDIIVTDEAGARLPAGAIGEICVRTPALMVDYWQRPGARDDAMRDGYYRTGDAGYLDDEGYIYLVDRVKDMIVSGGENIYPTEIENALLEHAAICEVAVIGIPSTKWGEAVHAVCVVRGEEPQPADLIAFLRTRIAGYKIPRSYAFVEKLPRNAAGKLLKRDLRDIYWGDQQRRIG